MPITGVPCHHANNNKKTIQKHTRLSGGRDGGDGDGSPQSFACSFSFYIFIHQYSVSLSIIVHFHNAHRKANERVQKAIVKRWMFSGECIAKYAAKDIKFILILFYFGAPTILSSHRIICVWVWCVYVHCTQPYAYGFACVVVYELPDSGSQYCDLFLGNCVVSASFFAAQQFMKIKSKRNG